MSFELYSDQCLEPISKSPEEDDQASELDEAEEVLWVILPSDEAATLPLNPCEEALDHPSPCISPQPASILGGRPATVGSMRCDHLDAVSTQLLIQRIAVVGAISNQVFGLGFDHVEIEAQLNQAYFGVVRCMRSGREGQTMTIHNRHDFQAFSSFRRADVRAAALRHCKGRVDKALFFVQHATRAKFVGDVSQDSAQNLALTPSLKPAVHGFVIRITLRQHVPLRARVQNPQRRFKDFPRRNRLPTRAPLGNVLFRKMMPDTLPIRIARPNHPTLIARP